ARSRLPRARYVLTAFVRAPTAERSFWACWRAHACIRRVGAAPTIWCGTIRQPQHCSSWEPRPRGEAFGLAGRLAPAFAAGARLPPFGAEPSGSHSTALRGSHDLGAKLLGLPAGWHLHSPRGRGSHHLVRNPQATTAPPSLWERRPRSEAAAPAARLPRARSTR